MLESRLQNVLSQCESYRDNVKVLKRQVETIEGVVDGYDNDIDKLRNEKMLSEKASTLFKQIADNRNKKAKEQIEKVLNYALSNIPLEQNYMATLDEVSSKRSGKELTVTLIDRDTGHSRSLRHQTGTWIAQVISFILTMIVIKFSNSSRLMILDEVFTGMEDHEMILDFGNILTSLAENEDFQIIMVEHRKELDTIEGITNIKFGLNGPNETKILSN